MSPHTLQATKLRLLTQLNILSIAVLMAPLIALVPTSHAQTMLISTTNSDFQITNTFSDVSIFNIEIEVDAPLARGAYSNPDIIEVTYQVMGTLDAGTPSGFTAFDLQRTISGEEFYAQGSYLNFEISDTAVLTDGIQVVELAGNGIVFTFDGKEIDNGRFHPALFELNIDGSGRIQNSNNIPSETPFQQINFGDEYITDLMFDPGNTTLITALGETPITEIDDDDDGGKCFIATAAYGSYFESEVLLLRQFRDSQLLTTDYGRAFVNFYYRISPPIANVIADHDSLKALTRAALIPVVYSIKYPLWSALTLLLFIAGIVTWRINNKTAPR